MYCYYTQPLQTLWLSLCFDNIVFLCGWYVRCSDLSPSSSLACQLSHIYTAIQCSWTFSSAFNIRVMSRRWHGWMHQIIGCHIIDQCRNFWCVWVVSSTTLSWCVQHSNPCYLVLSSILQWSLIKNKHGVNVIWPEEFGNYIPNWSSYYRAQCKNTKRLQHSQYMMWSYGCIASKYQGD